MFCAGLVGLLYTFTYELNKLLQCVRWDLTLLTLHTNPFQQKKKDCAGFKAFLPKIVNLPKKAIEKYIEKIWNVVHYARWGNFKKLSISKKEVFE